MPFLSENFSLSRSILESEKFSCGKIFIKTQILSK